MTVLTQEARFQAEDIQLEEVFKITRTLIRIANSIDAKAWNILRAQFAHDVEVTFGETKPMQTMSGDNLVDWMVAAYSPLETLHMVSNHHVQIVPGIDVANTGAAEDTATVTSCGRVLHRRKSSDDYWNLDCRYEHELLRTEEGWKVTRLTIIPFGQQGNPRLLEHADR
jgi:hypothetical protein